MENQILEILKTCIALKEKGHDAFFDYSPHVDVVYVRVYINGWKGRQGDADVYMEAPSKPCKIYSTEYVKDELDIIHEKLKEIGNEN